jgi:hypothetical protein
VWAFSDESERANRVLLAVVLARPPVVHATRAELRGLLLPGQRRIHTSDESARRRRILLDTLARIDGLSTVAFCYRRPMGVDHVEARAILLDAATRHVTDKGVRAWTLDNQDPPQRARDRATIAAALRTSTVARPLVYDHRRSTGGGRYSKHALFPWSEHQTRRYPRRDVDHRRAFGTR